MKKYNSIFNIINQNKINVETIIDDYITFFILKYNFDYYNEINLKLINLILDLRFNEKYEIFEDNKDNSVKIFLMKLSWLEANKNNVFDIINIYSILRNIFDDDRLYKYIEEYIKNKKIVYISEEYRNSKQAQEVNECYYIILVSMCLNILPPKIEIQMNDNSYFQNLNIAAKYIQSLVNQLQIFLKELYVLDEINKIYEVVSINNFGINDYIFTDAINIIINNNDILQSTDDDKYEKLSSSFRKLYESLNKIFDHESIKYYKLLSFIYYKEIRKITDPNYRITIFEYLIKDNEIIVNSMNILKMLLQSLVIKKMETFKSPLNNILNSEKEAEKLVENIIKDEKENSYLALSETMLYFFEKNSVNYLTNIFKEKKKHTLNDEPLEYFRVMIGYLSDFLNKDKNIKNKNNINICKLYCIGYIKVFCHTFIRMIHNNKNEKLKNVSAIIKEINNIDAELKDKKNIGKTIKLYIYKVIYYLNNKQFEVFIKDDTILKYKLNELNFKEFIKNDQINIFKYKDINAINESPNYEYYLQIIEKYKLENFEKEKIKLEEFDLKKYGIDILFFTTSNLINSCFDINNDFTPSIFYKNFYKNVLVPLFRECDFKTNKNFNAMKIFYDPEKFESIKRSFEIESKDMKILLYSYRWFLNEIYSLAEEGKNDSLYSKFYMGNFDNIKNYYYPGNDIHNSIPKYELLSNIVSHFSGPNSRMGCYVCLRGNGWYHNDTHLRCSKPLKDKKCDNCNEVLWKVYGYVSKELKPVIDDRYLRIFKDDQDKINNKKFLLDYKINHLTIDKFKEKYVKKYFEKKRHYSY